jgi:SAM-dependent methyltransferase
MAASFRDPAGHLFTTNGRVFRIIKSSAADDLTAFLASETAKKFTDLHQLVRTDFLDAETTQSILSRNIEDALESDLSRIAVEHERIPFQSFPYEWTPQMLYVAGSLTLDLADDLLREGFGLKDATPYNILFRGPDPVFIDLLSFERRDPSDPTWLPYAQFVRTFLLPLLVVKHFGRRLDELLITHRDGLEPEEVYRLSSKLKKIRPDFLTLVSFPTWLASRRSENAQSIYKKRIESNPEKARFIVDRLLKGLRRKLEKVAPEVNQHSTWSDYMSKNRYTEDYFPEKEAFVQAAINESRPQRVLDVGCNTGYFSRLAAKSGAGVVAIDYDPVVAGEVWACARAERLDILPLVVDLTRPTPSIGWRNEECLSFLDRAKGSFDVVLMLAVIHHMLVSERIPLLQVLQLASELTTSLLIVEFVAPTDKMFRVLTRGRDDLHKDLTVEVFETVARRFFDIERSRQLGESDRWIYLLRRKGSSTNA